MLWRTRPNLECSSEFFRRSFQVRPGPPKVTHGRAKLNKTREQQQLSVKMHALLSVCGDKDYNGELA